MKYEIDSDLKQKLIDFIASQCVPKVEFFQVNALLIALSQLKELSGDVKVEYKNNFGEVEVK